MAGTTAKRNGQKRRLPVVLEKEEVEALKAQPNVKCPTGLRNRAMLEAMHGLGLRVSEVVKLRPSHIRWTEAILEVRDGKGGKDRNIPIDQETLAWLRAWDAKRPKGARWFFSTLKGGKLCVRYIEEIVKRFAVRALGEERGRQVTPHKLRHTYATELLDEGFNLREVQELLGHSNVATTEIYTHVNVGNVAAKIQVRRRVDIEPDPKVSALVAALNDLGLSDEQKAQVCAALAGGGRKKRNFPLAQPPENAENQGKGKK